MRVSPKKAQCLGSSLALDLYTWCSNLELDERRGMGNALQTSALEEENAKRHLH